MARPPRLDGPGVVHHVVHRGNRRQRIFTDAADYGRYVDLLDEGVARFGHEVLAFCLMPNHVHLVVRTGDVPLSRIIQNAAFRFAAWNNRRHERDGHVFQGRFRSFIVARDSYLRALVRYVHQNPVRAGMVTSPEHHLWNSHREYLGSRRFPWVTPGPVLALFGDDPRTARAAYLEACASETEEPPPPEMPVARRGPAPSPLRTSTSRQPLPLDRILGAVAREFDLEPPQVLAPAASRFSPAALVVGLVLRDCGGVPLARWAERLGRDTASLSRSLRRLEARASGDPELVENVARVYRALGLREPLRPSDGNRLTG